MIGDILRIGAKLLLFSILLGFVGMFTNYLIGLIPPININGCMGYYADQFGIFKGFQVMLSIVLYGFVVKYGLSFFSNYLN
jgi:hypothetical protein